MWHTKVLEGSSVRDCLRPRRTTGTLGTSWSEFSQDVGPSVGAGVREVCVLAEGVAGKVTVRKVFCMGGSGTAESVVWRMISSSSTSESNSSFIFLGVRPRGAGLGATEGSREQFDCGGDGMAR